jgi:hypothetical protein
MSPLPRHRGATPRSPLRIAEITGGAYGKFDPSAPQRLSDLLRSAAIYAAGGLKALANQNSEAARLLISQLKH